MDRHADLGADLTDLLPELRHLTPIVRACQEHWDGGGYPLGIGGEQIPLAARIISVADAFHAMTSDRPYRRAMPLSAAATELRRCAGSQFEPYSVAALLAVVGVTLRKDVESDAARVASAA
jgi:HD-GYP domain-containing protein (c-di-GMP phosphodiesterase class II)